MRSYWKGCFHPIEEKKAGSVSLWSTNTPRLYPTPPHQPASYLTNEPTKDPLHCLQRPIERERWHVHMQLSSVYSGAQSEGVYTSACVCVCSHMQYYAHFLFLSLCLYLSFFSLRHTHTCTDTPIDCWGTGWSCSPWLRGLALACLLPFPFCSSARSPFPSMYWRWVEAYHGQGSPHHHKNRKKKRFRIWLWI